MPGAMTCLRSVLLHDIFRLQSKIPEFRGHQQCLAGDRHRGEPNVRQRRPRCVPYNIFADGGVTQAALNYLYLLGTATGTLRRCARCMPTSLASSAITASPRRSRARVWASTSASSTATITKFFQPRLRGGERACCPDSAARWRRSTPAISVGEEFIELRAPLMQDQPGAKELLFDTGYRHSDLFDRRDDQYLQIRSAIRADRDYRLRVSYDRAIRAPSVASCSRRRSSG